MTHLCHWFIIVLLWIPYPNWWNEYWKKIPIFLSEVFHSWSEERQHEKLRQIKWQSYFHSGAQNIWDNEQTSLDRCAAADLQGKLQIYLLPDSEWVVELLSLEISKALWNAVLEKHSDCSWSRRFGPGNLQSWLPTSAILWFCDYWLGKHNKK